jgi:cytosolic carboxypeptidase protein 2/3
MFMFGPDYNLTQPEYYKCRVFPKLLASHTNIFRYYSCSYTIPSDKRSTARAVMLSEMLIPQVFTVESSLGFYHDFAQHKSVPFTKKKWVEIGEHVVMALKEYFEGLQQYE